MKTSNKSLLTFCVSVVFMIVNPFGSMAQGLRTSYFMDNVSARLKMNPALQPARGYFNFPVAGAIGVSASSNTLSIDNFIDIIENENDFLNSNKFINRLDTKNTMNIDVVTDVISFGFYSGKAFWTVNLGARAIVSTSIPKSMFEFAQNSNHYKPGDLYNIKNMELHADVFTELGVGYSRSVTDNLIIGGRLKLLVGMGNLDAKIDEIYVDMKDEYTRWQVRTKGHLEASVKGLELGYNSEEGYIDDVDFDSPGVSGYGVGIDLGASYRLLDCINLSAAVLDLGFIQWSKSSTKVAITEGNHTYGELGVEHPGDNGNQFDDEGSDIFDLDLIQFKEQEAKARKTSLRSTLNIGAEYTLLNNKLGLGVLSSTQFLLPTSYSELTVSANYRPKNWFGTTLSYSFLHSEFKTIGLGLKLGPIFIGSDYIMTKAPSDANRVNAYVGISIPLGKKRMDYRN